MNDVMKRLKVFHFLFDAVMILLAYLTAYYLRFYTPLFHNELGRFYPLERYISLLVYLVPIYISIYFFFRLYSVEPERHRWYLVLRGVISNVVGFVFLITLLFFRKEYNVSRTFLLLFLIINIVLTIGSRVLISNSGKLKPKRGKGIN